MRHVASPPPQSVGASLLASSFSWPARHRGASLAASSSRSRSLSLLRHRHLEGITSYDAADEIQERHRSLFLSWKASPDAATRQSGNPPPLLVSFESTPTFTLGRRQQGFSADQAAHLRRKLDVNLPCRRQPILKSFYPEVKGTNRGGLTTYHGPGQLVLWPVIDMHSSIHARFGVTSYANHLETTTQRLLAELFGIRTSTVRDEPGVWVDASGDKPRKISAMGVHLRRHVTSLGIAVNVDVAVDGGEDVNPWSRFVPCGLEGKAVTSVASELGSAATGPWDMAKLAARWASIFEEGLVNNKER